MSTAARTPRPAPPARPPELTVVIPTRNEAEAVGPLCRDLAARLDADGLDWEALFVDDSDDDTAVRLRRLAARDPRIRVHHRDATRGLGSAITTGLALARGRFVAVIDADGQHPPGLLTRMLGRARDGAGVVVASRFAPGGSLGDIPAVRRRVARFARGAARVLVPAARATSDPLSGCFLVRREAIAGRRLRPASWKVLLEVLAAAGSATVADVAYRFGRRRNGESKLGARAVAAFGLHALGLAWRGRRPLAIGLQYAIAVRVGLLAVTLLTLAIPQHGQALPALRPTHLWRLWAEWDGLWYERIAWLGYAGRHAYAFFPLYPLLLRAVAGLTGMGLAAAGVLVSGVASVACFALLYDQVALDHGPATAERAVRYLALFPTGFFLAAAYTESTFLALALLAMRALRRRDWGVAAAAGAGAALTRNMGIVLALPAAWAWLRERGLRPSLAMAGAPAGLAVYMLFCAWTRGDPLAFLHAESFWSRHLAWPWTTAAHALQASLIGGPYAARNAVDLATVAAAAIALSAGRRWLHPTERLFAWAVLAMTVAAPLPVGHGEVLLSSTRLVLAAYPAFVVLARFGRRPAVDRFVTAVFPLAQAAAFILFTHSYFVA